MTAVIVPCICRPPHYSLSKVSVSTAGPLNLVITFSPHVRTIHRDADTRSFSDYVAGSSPLADGIFTLSFFVHAARALSGHHARSW